MYAHLLTTNRPITVESDGEAETMTWGEFAEANAEMPDLNDVAEALRAHGHTSIGGGASPLVTVRIADAARTLRCDMHDTCTAPVTHLDEKGYVYCTAHGEQRRGSGRRCRKLRPSEVKRLQRGETLKSY